MTISSQTRKAGPFVGNDSTTAFPFAFKVFSAADMYVVKTDTDLEVETVLVLNTDYTVSLNADQNANPGGTITLPSALATGFTLTVTSNISPLQQTDLTNQGGFYPSVITNALDKLTILIQQALDSIGRSLKLPVSTPSGVSTTLPLPSSNKLIGWNQDADGLQNVDPTTLATIVAFGTANADVFDGDGATTQFNLTANPGALNNLDVSIGGVTQTPGIDYTWTSGTVITFTSAPPVGTDNVLVRYMQGLPQGSTAANLVSYTPAGAGAQATEVQASLRKVIFSSQYSTLAQALAAAAGNIIYIEGANAITASLTPASNTTIEFLPGASVTVTPGSPMSTGDAIFKCDEKTGVTIKLHGATLTGERKGTGTADIVQGVSFLGSTDCVCIGPGTIRNCAGDGGYIGAASDNTPIYSERCGFRFVTFDNNMRNGCAVTSGIDCFADFCTFTRTNGKAPEAGLDVEPEGGSTRMVFRSVGCVASDNAKFDFMLVLGGNATPVTTSVGVELLDFIARDSRTYTETIGLAILNHKDTMANDGYVKVRGKCMNINNHGLMVRNIDKDGQGIEFDVDLVDTSLVSSGSMVAGVDSPCVIYTNTPIAAYADPGGIRGKLRVVDNTRDRTPYYITSAGNPWTDIVLDVDWINTVGKTSFPFMDAATANTYIRFTPEPYRVNRTSNITLSARHSNFVLSNKGAGGAVAFTLPAVAAGLRFTFEVFANQILRITPNAADRLRPYASADAKYMESSEVGSSAVVYANQDATDWVVQRFGTWTDEP